MSRQDLNPSDFAGLEHTASQREAMRSWSQQQATQYEEDADLTLPAFVATIFIVLALINAPALWALVRGVL